MSAEIELSGMRFVDECLGWVEGSLHGLPSYGLARIGDRVPLPTYPH